MGWDRQLHSGSVTISVVRMGAGQVLSVNAQATNTTYLQKLNKTCRGQTIPEAVRALSEQT